MQGQGDDELRQVTKALADTRQTLQRTEKKLAEQHNQLRSLIDNLPDSIFVKDTKSRYVLNNKAHLKTLGPRTQEEVRGRTVLELRPADLADKYLVDDKEILEKGRPSLTRVEQYLHEDGRIRWTETKKVLLRSTEGKVIGLLGVSRDVTHRKRAEEELLRKNTELDQFVYTVSHDLKSPLVTVEGFLALLEEDLAAGDLDSVNDSVGRIRTATRRLSQLIDDLLKLSRAGRVVEEFEKVDVQALVTEFESELTERLNDVGARLVVDDPLPAVMADAKGLSRVFENLLSNALKYGCTAPAPTITIGSQRVGREIRFFVKDNGPGIAPEYHRRIFGLFQRLENKAEGTGVGLAVVAKIMQVHGGRAWVESSPGEGTTFWMSFPARSTQPNA